MSSLQRLFGHMLRNNLSGYPNSSGTAALGLLDQAYHGTVQQYRPYIKVECVAPNRGAQLSRTVLELAGRKPTRFAGRQPSKVWVTVTAGAVLDYLPGRVDQATASSPTNAWSDLVISLKLRM